MAVYEVSGVYWWRCSRLNNRTDPVSYHAQRKELTPQDMSMLLASDDNYLVRFRMRAFNRDLPSCSKEAASAKDETIKEAESARSRIASSHQKGLVNDHDVATMPLRKRSKASAYAINIVDEDEQLDMQEFSSDLEMSATVPWDNSKHFEKSAETGEMCALSAARRRTETKGFCRGGSLFAV